MNTIEDKSVYEVVDDIVAALTQVADNVNRVTEVTYRARLNDPVNNRPVEIMFTAKRPLEVEKVAD